MITTSVKRYRAYVTFITFDTQCLSTCIYFPTCRPIVLYLLASCEAELNCHHWYHATPLQTLPPTRCYSINSQGRATKQCKFYTQQFSLPWCLLLTATKPSCVRTQRNTITGSSFADTEASSLHRAVDAISILANIHWYPVQQPVM